MVHIVLPVSAKALEQLAWSSLCIGEVGVL